jgi:hypothetical protein
MRYEEKDGSRVLRLNPIEIPLGANNMMTLLKSHGFEEPTKKFPIIPGRQMISMNDPWGVTFTQEMR